MSLHLGNLPPRIRKDELERIFCKFGRCTVQLKDGFGFAVFDFRADAEKAFRALEGRKICGERIYLSWSRKQPKPPISSTRTDRSRDMKYERTFGRVGNHIGLDLFSSSGNKTMNNNQQDDGRARQMIEEVSDCSFNHNNGKLKRYQQKEEFSEEEGYINSNQDNGKQTDEAENLQNVNGDDKEMDFDRYEPDRADKRGKEYDQRSLGHTEGSLTGKMFLDKNNRGRHADSVRRNITCFNCGAAGHKMRDCPLEDALHGKSLYHSGRGHEIETNSKSRGGGNLRGAESRFRRRPQPHSWNSRPVRQNEADWKPSHSKRNGTNARSIPMENMSTRTNRKDYYRERQRENGSKRSKRLALSHLQSDQTSPQLGKYSRPLKPSSNSISLSRSESPIMCSPSPRSRSKKISNRSRSRSRSRSVKSKSRSGASSPSSSLSTSIGRSLSLSPNREGIDINGSFGGAPDEIGVEIVSIENKPESGLSGYVDDSSHHLEEALIECQQLELNLEDENATSINHVEVCLNGSLDDQIPESRQVLALTNSPQIGDAALQSDDTSFALEMRDEMNMHQLHDDDNSSSDVPPISCKIKVPSPPSVEERRDAEKRENGNGTEMTKSLETSCESDPKSPSEDSEGHVGSHLGISVVELCEVLKHYGLMYPEDGEQKLSVDAYFGSARLWPWQLIYYMRVKKGVVSEANNAKRVAQNTAFGIRDK